MQIFLSLLFHGRFRGDAATGLVACQTRRLFLIGNTGQSPDNEGLLLTNCSTGGPKCVCLAFLGGRLAHMQHMEIDLLECETMPSAFLPQVFYSFDWHMQRKWRIIEEKTYITLLCYNPSAVLPFHTKVLHLK